MCVAVVTETRARYRTGKRWTMPRARKSETESMYTIYSHMNAFTRHYLRAIHAHMQQHTDTIARDHRIDTLACVYECVLQCFVCCVHTLSRNVSHIHILFTRVMLLQRCCHTRLLHIPIAKRVPYVDTI